MAHRKVYGICENKCRVEIPSFYKITRTVNVSSTSETIGLGNVPEYIAGKSFLVGFNVQFVAPLTEGWYTTACNSSECKLEGIQVSNVTAGTIAATLKFNSSRVGKTCKIEFLFASIGD